MENSKTLLLAELPGLEAAKAAIDMRIDEIKRIYYGTNNPAAPKILKPLPVDDPSIMGRDLIGRINRRRTISPEDRKLRVERINKAREGRLDRLRQEGRLKEQQEVVTKH